MSGGRIILASSRAFAEALEILAKRKAEGELIDEGTIIMPAKPEPLIDTMDDCPPFEARSSRNARRLAKKAAKRRR